MIGISLGVTNNKLVLVHVFFITLQPVMFENIVMETLHMLREMAANGETEKRKVIDPSVMHSSHTLTFLTTQCMT